MSRFVLGPVLCAVLTFSLRGQTLIDNFENVQSAIVQTTVDTDGSTVAGAMVGGERDLNVTVTVAGSLTTEVKGGALSFSQAAGTVGTAQVVWDGVDGAPGNLASAGLGSLDLTAGSQDAFLLGVLSCSKPVDVTLTIYSATGTRAITVTVPSGEKPNYLRIPFSSFTGPGSFAAVGAIELGIGSSPGATLSVDFLRTISTAVIPQVEGLLTDVLLIDNNGNGKADPGDSIRYSVRITNNDSVAKNGVQFNASTPANTTLGAVTTTPVARADGPGNNSLPGSAFHTALNTSFVADSSTGVIANDSLGDPSATLASFGGGTLGGSVTSFAAGATASVGGHSLMLNADGSLTYTPANNFVGLFSFQYRLSNSAGSSDAVVAIAVGARPSAVSDSFAVTGNTMIDSSLIPLTLTANDLGDGLSVTELTQPAHGSVTQNGAYFSYTPDPSFTGSDSFSYTLHNALGETTGTVNLTVANKLWYIDNTAALAGDGRSSSPFNSLAAFNAANGGGAGKPGSNDLIFLRQGNGVYQNMVNNGPALLLLNGQQAVGDGWSGTFAGAFGFSLAAGSAVAASTAVPSMTGTDPVVSNPGTSSIPGSVTSASAVTLATGNTLRGITLGDTPNGWGIVGGSVGTVTLEDCSKNGAGGAILIVTGGTIASSGANFNTVISSASPGDAVLLTNVSGSLICAAGSITAPVGAGVKIAGGGGTFTYNGSITKNTGGGLVVVTGKTGGSVSLGGTLTQTHASGTGIYVGNNSGTTTVSFSGAGSALNTAGNTPINFRFNSSGTTLEFTGGTLDLDTTSAAALYATDSGTLRVTQSGNTIFATTAPAIDASGVVLDLTFADLKSTGGARNLSLNGVSGSLSATTGTMSGSASGNPAFYVNGGSATVTYGGTISKTTPGNIVQLTGIQNGSVTLSGNLTASASGGISVTSCTGGTMTFSGGSKVLNTGSGNAVHLSSNSGTQVDFTGGGLDIDTTSGFGFNASNSGPVSVSGANNTIDSWSGTALSVANTAISSSGLTFRSISAGVSGNPANGIFLSATGTNGGLTVTGDGSNTTLGGNASGGTIRNTTGSDTTTAGIGIYLNNTGSVILRRMKVNDHPNFGIWGNSVRGLTMEYSTVNSATGGSNGSNEAYDEGSVGLAELSGTASILKCVIADGRARNFSVINTTGVLNRIVFDDVTIGLDSTSYGSDGLFLQAQGTATFKATVSNSRFLGSRGDLFQMDVAGAAVGDLIFQNNTVNNTHSATLTGGGGITLSAGGESSTGTFTFDINGGTFKGARGNAIAVLAQVGAATLNGKVRNATIGATGTNGSGSSEASGIEVRKVGGTTVAVTIDSNSIYQYSNYGINLQQGDNSSGTGGTLAAKVSNNTISTPSTAVFTKYGIQVNSGTLTGDAYAGCFDILNNTTAGSGSGTDIRVRQRFNTTVALAQYGGASGDTAAVAAYLQARNTGAEVASAAVSGTGGGFVGGSGCTTP